MDELNQFVPKESRINMQQLFKETKYTFEDAKKRFPEWYQRVILQKEHTVRKWDISGKVHGDNPFALYDWWLAKIKEGATFGHRYFCVMMLAIYAVKCDVPREQLEQDAAALIPWLNALGDEPFTVADAESALECYDDRYATFPLRDIEKLSAIEIPRNKRNGRSRLQHMAVMRAIQDVVRPDWRNTDGRPNKQLLVFEWRLNHPDGKKIECERDTGLSRKTILKWWDNFPANVT